MDDFGDAEGGSAQDEDQYLRFLIDEGLVLLGKFRRIRDAGTRQLVVALIDALSEAESGTPPTRDASA